MKKSISFIFALLISFNLFTIIGLNVASAQNDAIKTLRIEYTGGENNIKRFIPKDFRNETYKDTGDLRLPGSSIKIMSPENEKYIKNVEQTIELLNYIKNSIGFEKALESKEQLLSITLYDESIDTDIIQKQSVGYDSITVGNPTLGMILGDTAYIDPTLNASNLTVKGLEDALLDLNEHNPEGSVNNFIYTFTKFNLLVIETMAILFIVYGGLVWVTAAGDDSQIEKGKKIILWAVVAVLGGLISYTILNAIIQIFTT